MRKQKGFSLIELLIVVAIILIIAAIAIPNLLKSRMAANESAAASNLRTLNSALMTYMSTYNNGFPGALSWLIPNTSGSDDCDSAGLLDSSWDDSGGNVQKQGYEYNYTQVGTQLTNAGPGCTNAGYPEYTIDADPISCGSTGNKGYWTDESGLITVAIGGTCDATSTSDPL